MLRPSAHISPDELRAGQRDLVRELAWSSLTGAFGGGVILTAFALALGATPLHIGLLAAIPFIAQAVQLPAAMLIERIRHRRGISLVALTVARLMFLLMAVLPFLPSLPVALYLLMVSQVLIASLNAVGGCAINSWLHQLIAPRELGNFFARRLFSGTVLACVGTLAAGWLVDNGPMAGKPPAYAIAFVLAGAAGLVSSYYLARSPEPTMPPTGPQEPLARRLAAPFRDTNFRRLLTFMGAWTVASNIAAPFITLYLMRQRGYAVVRVTELWVVSQLANALTLYLWGRLSDRLSNKRVLAFALPLHFASMLALVFAASISAPVAQLALLAAVHVVLGVATGGIGLASGNLGLKLAPQGQGTAYLAAIGLVSALAGGVAPIAAGALAQALKASAVSAVIRWATPGGVGETALITFAHWEFMFGLSAVLGLYVMHALSRIDEGPQASERLVIQEFALEAWRSLNNLSSVAGTLGNLFPFERLSERRRWWRERSRPGAGIRSDMATTPRSP